MLERMKNCICHPKFIGRYHKDKVGKIIFISFLFFLMYLVVFGVRTFNENPYGEQAESLIVSEVISKQVKTVEFDKESNCLSGDSVSIVDEAFGIYIFPQGNDKMPELTINIVLLVKAAKVYYGNYEIGTVKYEDIKTESFSFDMIAKNDPTHIFNFRGFVSSILESSYTFLRAFNFGEGVSMAFMTFMVVFLVSFIFAKLINPTIEGKVRAKLSLYDTNIFLVCAIMASLFNLGWIAYIGYMLPIIYTSITFKHIIRVVIPKK